MLVGVTGNFGSGKSELCRALERFGCRTYDADRIVDILYRDGHVLAMLESVFGEEVVKNGAVDRKALSKKAFNSGLSLRKLNGIMHPMVRERISLIPHNGEIVFVEVPLLFEAGMRGLFDRVVLVRASHETCRRRAVKRGFSEEDFERRVSSQYAAERVEAMSDFVVDSECTPGELGSKAEKILERLRAGG
ncbi:MAG: dephospho-CoA kinase [Candidatus Diapherotrites archaeon]|uniref:Dephospho-CoA kinase n=1 Tax=Candidatus Iainarchaeum sp. TaxID=3101447 RepID=A0A8T3YH89_9ARCH|nr:dephospho-CoA kinase [Candidatus Diapherotrites archaeon]